MPFNIVILLVKPQSYYDSVLNEHNQCGLKRLKIHQMKNEILAIDSTNDSVEEVLIILDAKQWIHYAQLAVFN